MAARFPCVMLAASVAVVASPSSIRAAEALPILSGRWSAADCAHSTPAETRWFAPNLTASVDDRCRMSAEKGAGGLYRAHLACRYRTAHDATDNVVLEVVSPGALRWVDQCSATLYRFCERGAAPSLAGPPPR